MKLFARPEDDLNWAIEGNPSLFEFDFGPILLEDELFFNACAAALTRFTSEIWPKYPDCRSILYRGSADFSKDFQWTERQEANFKEWNQGMAFSSCDLHLKRLFCIEAYGFYFQMLAHKLPDEMPIELHLDPKETGTLAETLHLLSPERFEHFILVTGLNYSSNIGVCFPIDTKCSKEVLKKIDFLLTILPHFRPVYENLLTEQWDGLDEIYVISETLTERGLRKLLGFEAAGGTVIEFGTEGFSL